VRAAFLNPLLGAGMVGWEAMLKGPGWLGI
jgi:hypothetical protein